ncbi:hypothetical protein PCANC_04616 [Puccinia coronata f. sp. avenae]|uniref:Core-binding (CB) domain-containing protein n=1 Tax=Puccinia coronata f. sp. avenae TaxID=200324 RepID=A0A2N5W068_9BASI|nr:hypothetical protein PCANC_04616 [Puccinia coronata f. sp. avenae]
MDLIKIKAFLGKGRTTKNPNPKDLHVLRGYKPNTLLSYNAVAKKLIKSMRAKGKFSFKLPISAKDVYNFCYWAGREEDHPTQQDVSANTLQKYLYSIKAWHLFHNKEYPHTSEAKVAVMLRSSAREDAALPKKEEKKAVTLEHLVLLTQNLMQKGKKEREVLDIALVAFWGLERLGEITYQSKAGDPNPRKKIHVLDVRLRTAHNGTVRALITLRDAKTGKPSTSISRKGTTCYAQ